MTITPSPAKHAFDPVDRAVTPRLEGLARSDGFADVLAVVVRLRVEVGRQIHAISSQLLHGLNLPTAGDISRVRTDIADTQRQLRALADTLTLGAAPAASTTKGGSDDTRHARPSARG